MNLPTKQPSTEATIELTDSPSASRDSLELDTEATYVAYDTDTSSPTQFKVDRDFALILFVLWFGNFLTSLDGTIVSTTMSNIAADFGQSDLVTWIATSYLLTSTAFQPLYGKTSDILGRKELLLAAQGLFCFGIFLSSIAVNVQTLSIARAVSGMGGAGIFALSNIVISDVVPLSHRSIYMGYGNIVASASQMLGGPVGGLCIVTVGWRMMFLMQVPPLLVCMYLLWTKVEIKVDHIPEGPERYSKENLERIDIYGIITLNLAVSSIIFLLSASENASTTYKAIFSAILVISSFAYIYVEKYVAVEQLVDPKIVKGQIGILGIVNCVSALSLYMVLFVIPLYLQIVQGISVTKIGYYTMFFVVSVSAGALVSGHYIRKFDKSEAETMIASTASSLRFYVVQAVGYLVLLLVVVLTNPESESYFWRFILIVSLVVSGFGAGGYNVGIGIFVIGKAGKRDQASANTVTSLIRQLGNVLGVSISLAQYSSSLSSKLHEYFLESDNSHYITELLQDSNFIRSGLPEQYIADVLQFYRFGITKAFYLPLYLSVVALTVMYLVDRRVKRDLTPVALSYH